MTDAPQLVPLKHVTRHNNEILPETTNPETPIKYIEISDVQSQIGIVNSTSLTFGDAPSRARRIIRTGDVLVSTVRTYLRAIASAGEAHDGYIASTGFCVLRANKILPSYLKYAASSPDFVEAVVANSTGVSYPAINASDLVRLPIPVPDQPAQHRITAFLDHETAHIDALIAKQERLIELLAEKRQATIAQAVAKGLDPSVPTRHSGIPWLSQVNVGWAIRPLSAAGSISLGKMIQPASKASSDVQAPYLRAANVQPNGVLALGDVKQMWFNRRELEFLDLRRGDVIVVEGGIGGFGRAAYVKDDLFGFGYQNSINRIRPFHSVDGRFIAYLLLAARHSGFIHAYCTGVSMPHLTAEKLAAIRIPLPDSNSQSTISDYLDDKLSKLTLLSEKAVSVISILQERRSALISAAVTGKIDVREGAV